MTPCKAFGHAEGRNKFGACVVCARAYGKQWMRRYRASATGREAIAKYEASEHRLEGRRRYDNSVKGILRTARAQLSMYRRQLERIFDEA